MPAFVYCTALAASITIAAHLAAHLLAQRRRRRLLEQLLMAALNRALALAEVHDRAVLVAEDLELDVARRLDVLLDVDVADAERRFGLALRRLERVRQLAGARTTRMPRPPPPAVALMMTGYPISFAALTALSSLSIGPSLPGRMGTPAFFITRRARALSPIRRMTCGSGPMNLMWHASHTSARYALSDRNP